MAESMNEVQNTIRLTRFLIHRNPTMMSFNLDDVFSQSVQNVSNESGFAGVSAFQMFGYMAPVRLDRMMVSFGDLRAKNLEDAKSVLAICECNVHQTYSSTGECSGRI